jgi:hypothetical protein
MSLQEKIESFVQQNFKTKLEIFLEALRISPNAQGYVNGSITELLLKQHLENNGYEVKRIKEKWEGDKHPNHKGDLYFRKNETPNWFVLESKGVKSNTEDWNKLYNYNSLKNFLIKYSDIIRWINQNGNIEEQIISWIKLNLPEFLENGKYSSPLYKFNEIQKYKITDRKSAKKDIILTLQKFKREEINQLIDERIQYIQSKILVLDTHLVSGTSKSNEREQNTPRKDEFNILSVDIALRYPDHKFFFANPKNLDSSSSNEFHLQQNYIIGFVFIKPDSSYEINLTDEWYEDFNDVCKTLTPIDEIDQNEMQIDNRNVIVKK